MLDNPELLLGLAIIYWWIHLLQKQITKQTTHFCTFHLNIITNKPKEEWDFALELNNGVIAELWQRTYLPYIPYPELVVTAKAYTKEDITLVAGRIKEVEWHHEKTGFTCTVYPINLTPKNDLGGVLSYLIEERGWKLKHSNDDAADAIVAWKNRKNQETPEPA